MIIITRLELLIKKILSFVYNYINGIILKGEIMDRKKIKTFSILFLVLLASLFLVFISFIVSGKSLAWISTYDVGDGTRQHATFLKYIFDPTLPKLF